VRVRLVDDPRAEVGEDVGVGVRVGPMEFQLYHASEGALDRSRRCCGSDTPPFGSRV